MTCDYGIAMMFDIVAENPRRVAAAIMGGKICSPDVFLERSFERVRSLAAMHQIKHLSESGLPLGVEKENILFTLSIIHNIALEEPKLSAMIMEKGFYRLFTQSLVSLLNRLVSQATEVQNEGAVPSHTAANTHTLEIFDIALFLIDVITQAPTQVIRKIRGILDRGLLTLLVTSLKDIRADEPKFDTLLQAVIQYATYPSVIKAVARDFATAITPTLGFLPLKSMRRLELRGMTGQLRPLAQLRSSKFQDALCDNLKHRDHVRRGRAPQEERACSRCHSVVYCSVACQAEDWKALHRRECPHMRTQYLEQTRSLQYYPYRYRKYHASVVRFFYESNQVVRRTLVSTTPSKAKEYAPHEIDQAVTIVPKDEDRGLRWGMPVDLYVQHTFDLGAVAQHLRPRFKAFVGVFRDSVAKSRAQAEIAGSGHTPTTPILHDAPGAIRFVERAFRWADIEVNLVLLLRQTRVVTACTGTKYLNAEEEAAQSFHRDVRGKEEPLFKIVCSMVYECPRRHFAPMESVTAEEWPSAYLNAVNSAPSRE